MSPEPATKDKARRVSRTERRIVRFAALVGVLHKTEQRGDLASLRRMDPVRPFEPAFQRMLVRVAPKADPDETQRIALFVKMLALAPNKAALRNGRRPLGSALAAARITERRVQVLMTARGRSLDDTIMRLSRRLVREGPLPYIEIGTFLLGSEQQIERVRFSIARAYWTDRAEREDTEREDSQSETGDTAE